jgi:hypothetical protein
VPLRSVEQIRRAIDMMNRMRQNTRLEVVQQKDYRTWKADHDETLVGDSPPPEGWTADELGHNAEYVIRIAGLTDAQRGNYYGMPVGGAPYEIGVVRDKTDPTKFVLMYDFWGGGYGIEAQVGEGCQDFFQFYQMAGVELQAEEQGMPCEWTKKADGEYVGRVVELTGMGA